jgi:hypothetical protein
MPESWGQGEDKTEATIIEAAHGKYKWEKDLGNFPSAPF